MTSSRWSVDYDSTATSSPAAMQYGMYSAIENADARRVAVLLPLSGGNAELGRQIRSAVEMAVLTAGAENLAISFYDTGSDANAAMAAALQTGPEVIIGPVFADHARTLRSIKPTQTPVLSFTSDASAIGDGVMTMALMPTNSIETIVHEMSGDGATSQVILAPDTTSGHLMAGIAARAAQIYGINTAGTFFYTERDTDSIKTAAMGASMNAARTAANTQAREILSDILVKEAITAADRASLNRQLDALAREETTGKLPYDAVLFLGGGDDTKSAASFLRYYGVTARDAAFYGTAMWDGSDIASDFTMSGAKFASLPPANTEFASVYEMMTGTAPSRLADFGYDATNMAMGMLYSGQNTAGYLLNPSGYIGTDGIMRLKPTGENERGLRIMRLDGSGEAKEIKPAPANFLTPIYNVEQRYVSPAYETGLASAGINPMDYIKIPDNLRGKYKAKTYGARTPTVTPIAPAGQIVAIVPSDDDSNIITSPEYQPVPLEAVSRTYIDSVEITE